MKRGLLKKITASMLVGAISISTFATTAFAAETTMSEKVAQIVTTAISGEQGCELTDSQLRILAEEFSKIEWNTSDLNMDTPETRGAASKLIKQAAKLIKENLPKIINALKKIGIKIEVGKGFTAWLDDILNGVIEVDESIDEFIYTVVDKIAPGLNSNTKQIVANIIRAVLPF